jgi:hypothetical protein
MTTGRTIFAGGTAARRFTPSLTLFVALAVFALSLPFGTLLLNDPDPYWQIVAGRWILANHALPQREVFSYTMAGAPWIVHEWLAIVGIALVYDGLGWAGLVVAACLAIAVTVALLLRALLRYVEPGYAVAGALAAWGLMMPHSLARPHLFVMPIVVLWLTILVDARAAERAPSPWWALLMILWANLHGGFVLGDALIIAFAGEMALEQPHFAALRRQAFGWARFFAVSVVAGCLTPNGVAGFLLPFRLMGMHSVMANIIEWQSPDFQTAQPLEPWLLLVLLGALTFGVKLPVTRVVMLLVFVHEALVHRRFADMLGLAAPLLVAPALAAQFPSQMANAWGARLARWAQPASLGGTLVAALVALCLAAAPLAHGIDNASGPLAPRAALTWAQQHGVTGPVFNDLNFGGYLIYRGIAPFIDGRAELYGEAFNKLYDDDMKFPALLAQYHIAWTLLNPKDTRLAILENLPGWKRVYTDGIAVIDVRDPAP